MTGNTQSSVQAPPGAPGYRLTGLPDRLYSEGETPLLVHGQVVNIGDLPLDFTAGAPDRIALGARIYPVSNPQAEPGSGEAAVYETRGRLDELPLQPGDVAAFELHIEAGALASGTYRVVIDLLVEGRFWFADLGAPGHEIELDHIGVGPPRYALSFDTRSIPPRANGSLDLAGTLTNTGEQNLAFGEGTVRIGARVYAHADFSKVDDYRGIAPVLESRGSVSQGFVPPVGRSPFRLGVPLRELAPGRYVVIVDLVVEHAFWFADRGQVPYRLDFIRRRSGARLVAAGEGADPQAASDKVRQLDAIVADHTLESWPDIECWMAGPPVETAERDAPPPAAATAFQNTVVPLPGIDVPVTRLMLHLRAANRNEARWGLDSNRSALEFLKWYVLDVPREQRLPGRPVPHEIVDYLCASAFEPWLLPWPLSRLSLTALSEAPPAIAALTGGALEDFAFWWIGDFAERRSLDEVSLPPEIEKILWAYPLLSSPEEIPESPFLLRFLGANPKYAGRYDIASPSDRVALALLLLTRFLGQEGFGEYLSAGLVAYFGAPVDAAAMPVTRLEYLLWSYAQEGDAAPPGSDPSPPAIREWFRHQFRGSPHYLAYSSLPPEAVAREEAMSAPHLLLVGLTSGSSGLAANLAMSVAAAEALGARYAVCDAATGHWRGERVPGSGLSQAGDVTLFHINAELVPQALLRSRSRRLAASYKIGYFVWEIDAIPEAHRLALDLVDEIWTPSAFVRDTYARHTDRPVVVMGKGIAAPPGPATFPLQRYDVGPECFIFLTAFDFDSGIERKNPLAVVEAFRMAFPHDQNVGLIIKTNMALDSHWGDPHRQWRTIRQAASADPRIRVVVDDLPFAELIGLIRAAGCIVSAHRGEGFGYIPAYALLTGRPVIATDYSGTVDFCDEQTAYPVRWTAKPIQPGEFLYDVPGGSWAEIDIDHLAERMREVYEGPESARRRAEAGRARLSEHYSLPRYAERCRARLSQLGLIAPGQRNARRRR